MFGMALAILVAAPGHATAEEEDATLFPVPDYAGDWTSRPHASGDWNGQRQDLATKGVQLELDFVQTVQGVADGGIDDGTEYNGTLDYVMKVDVQKAGGWPGGFLTVRGETIFGDTVNSDTGSVMAANVDGLFPVADPPKTTLTDLNFIQFVHPMAAVVLGRISTLDGDANEFAHGRGTDQFLNLAFNINPVALRTVPYTGLGIGLILVPSEDIVIQFLALDAEGSSTEDGFDTAFKDGTVFSLEGRVATNFFDLGGHQTLGGTYSDRNFVSLEQDPRILLNILPRFRGMVPVARADDSWSVYYSFDQYLWQNEGEDGTGIGVFGRFGWADEDTSPVEWFVSLGIGGKGVIPGRENDSFGIGYFTVGASDEFPAFIDVDEGEGFEIYYNIAVTNWLNITPDIQVIEPAVKRLDTAVVLGLRTKIRF